MTTGFSLSQSLELAQKQYQAYYEGVGWHLSLKRFLRHPGKYIKRALAVRLGWWSTVPIKTQTCFRKDMFIFLPDKNAGSLHYFGFLPKREYLLSLYLAKTLKNNDVFYDVGANYGFYSVLADALIKGGEVHVFEPHPLLAKCLRLSLPNGACVNEVALSNKTAEVTFYDKYALGHSGGSTIIEEVGSNGEKAVSVCTVATTSLDEYIKTHTPPSVIKIDVEGAERLVLEGAREMLKKHHPLIAMEVWGGDFWKKYSSPAIDFLLQCGYAANGIGNDGVPVPIPLADLRGMMSTRKYENIIFS